MKNTHTRRSFLAKGALAGALSVAVENARLVREIVASERVKEQVKIARNIQEGLLPRNPEGVRNFELAGWSLPAEEALGDDRLLDLRGPAGDARRPIPPTRSPAHRFPCRTCGCLRGNATFAN